MFIKEKGFMSKKGINRRQFINNSLKTTAAAAIGSSLIPKFINTASAVQNKNALKGFIVSDAHIGWTKPDQPSLDTQLRLMEHIVERFPDLDVFLDTGDAHHNGQDRDKERGQWSDVIQGTPSQIPFYYVPGNHEITHTSAGDDEFICSTFGSISCRPYYSFDIKNIHFVSLPEMVRAIYIPKDALQWLELDLEANKDKTTILLSHNNIRGTTEDQGAYNYRSLIHSDQLMKIMNKYPNVISWMHGHHHTYEIVQSHQKLFVSNGRIGGFDPTGWDGEFGQGNLGGIYFEVTNKGLTVKCYSAEKECFLDQLGRDAVFTKTLPTKTSFDSSKPHVYSYGYGGARDGQKIPVFNHHANSRGSAELIITGTDSEVINDDPEFELFYAREKKNRKTGQVDIKHMLMGQTLDGDDETWKSNHPGVEIFKTDKNITLTVPKRNHSRHTYYRVAPNRKYKVTYDIDANEGGQKMDVTFKVHDRAGNLLKTIPTENFTLEKGKVNLRATVKLPSFSEHKDIYSDAESDESIHLSVDTTFSEIKHPVKINKVELSFADAKGKTKDAGVIINGGKYQKMGTIKKGQLAKFNIPKPSKNRSTCKVMAKGNHTASFLIRQKGSDWQVRNATVVDKGDSLKIGPIRNKYSHKKEIIINPTKPTNTPYVNKFFGIDSVSLSPLNRRNDTIKIDIMKLAAPKGKILIPTFGKKIQVTGPIDSLKQINKYALLEVSKPATIEISVG